MRLQTGVCETLMLVVVVLEAHQNHRSYFRFTMKQFSMVGGYTKDPRKALNCQNWGGWALARGWALAWDNILTV